MIKGIYAASMSILNDDLSLDVKKTIKHAETIIDHGCHGVAIFGSTGQAQLIPVSEKINLLKSKFLERYTQIITTDIHLYDGVEELLNYLTEKSISWGIVTNKSAKYTLPIIEKLNWHKQTSTIICPEDVHQTKPNPEGVHKALNSINASIEESFYVGDHERDIQTAKNASVKSACTYGYFQTDPLNWGADYIIDSPTEIKNIL